MLMLCHYFGYQFSYLLAFTYVVLYAKGSPLLCCSVHVAVLCELLAYLCCRVRRVCLMLVTWCVLDRGGGLCGVVGVIFVYFSYVGMFLIQDQI
jgi:hypothetical protein